MLVELGFKLTTSGLTAHIENIVESGEIPCFEIVFLFFHNVFIRCRSVSPWERVKNRNLNSLLDIAVIFPCEVYVIVNRQPIIALPASLNTFVLYIFQSSYMIVKNSICLQFYFGSIVTRFFIHQQVGGAIKCFPQRIAVCFQNVFVKYRYIWRIGWKVLIRNEDFCEKKIKLDHFHQMFLFHKCFAKVVCCKGIEC